MDTDQPQVASHSCETCEKNATLALTLENELTRMRAERYRLQEIIRNNEIGYHFFNHHLTYFRKFSFLYNLLKIKEKIKSYLTPRLGRLVQYQAKSIKLPAHYDVKPQLSNAPVISIVTPSYNQAIFLGATLDSVLDQAYPALELIVQDGGSTDHSAQILKKYESSLKHWESVKDNGQSHAINLGFRHATGEIMAYLNSDDILLPGTLHYVAAYFEQHPEVDAVYGHRILIDENGDEIGKWVLPPHTSDVLTWADFVPQETLFWRRRIWDKVNSKIDESFRFAMDWDLLLRFKDAGANFVRLPRFLGAFRVHGAQKTSAQMSEVGEKEMERLRFRCHGRKVTQDEISKKIRPYLIRHIICDKLYKLGLINY